MTSNDNTIDLHHFISKQMRMSHIYQPVMIKALLQSGGEALEAPAETGEDVHVGVVAEPI